MKNKKRVEEILGHYSFLTDPQKEKLVRLLNTGRAGGSGYLVILPVDQGFEHGPGSSFEKNPPAYDPSYFVKLAVEGGCSAYAAPLGALESVYEETQKINLPTILKVNSHELMMPDEEDPFPAVTAGVQDALRLKCVAVGFTIYPGSSHSREMYQQLRDLTRDARAAGLLVVVWTYPRGSGLPRFTGLDQKTVESALDVICYGVHIACQLGAHIVKCKPTTPYVVLPRSVKENLYKDLYIQGEESSQSRMRLIKGDLSERTRKVIQSAFNGKRIVIHSGGAKKEISDLLEEIQDLKRGGSFGAIVGRNAFQRPFEEGVELLHKIEDIYS